jgi:hypothetical protein
MMTMKSYSELCLLQTYRERLEYLKLDGRVGEATFGWDRYLNQTLYRSYEWKRIRNQVIIRDNGCDLGVEGYELHENILIHHINPITKEDIINRAPCVFDMNNLISTSMLTHNAIHYSSEIPNREPIVRTKNDTCPWR